jgi:hypothetical protein
MATTQHPTRLRVNDSDAIASLLAFGLNHRAAVADQCLRRFPAAKTDADRLSLAVECFMCLIANVEDLEKAYFAMRLKTAGAKGSFLELYTNTGVTEPRPSQAIGNNERSARFIRREVGRMSVKRFVATLGLPEFQEWTGLGYAPAGATPRELRKAYYAEMRGLMTRIGQAVGNRAAKRLMNVYNKSKHGFVALHWESPLTLLLVERASGKKRSVCWIQCMPFRATENSMSILVGNTKTLAQTMARLVALYGRVH